MGDKIGRNGNLGVVLRIASMADFGRQKIAYYEFREA